MFYYASLEEFLRITMVRQVTIDSKALRWYYSWLSCWIFFAFLSPCIKYTNASLSILSNKHHFGNDHTCTGTLTLNLKILAELIYNINVTLANLFLTQKWQFFLHKCCGGLVIKKNHVKFCPCSWALGTTEEFPG